VEPKAVPKPKAKNRHDRFVIQQATERLPPVEETVIRSVLARRGAEADAFAGAPELLCIDQSIQLGHLRRLQDVVDHQIAVKIEQVLLQLPVRSVHGHTLPCPCSNAEYATGARRAPRLSVILPTGRNAMSEPRFTTLTREPTPADQKRAADPIQSAPRGVGLRGPFTALLRSPELCDLVQRVGAYVRFVSSIPPRLNEMAIIMAGRKWTAQYEFYAHRR